MQLWEPTLADVLTARKNQRPFLRPTPLIKPFALCQALGCEVWVKCENLQPIGAFKIRGGINLLSNLTPQEREKGVITASTGNHGQSIAYAARAFGAPAIVAVPEKANPFKVEALRHLGAEVVVHGRDFDEARLWVEETAKREGYRYVHSMNEPLLIAGVATAYMEILEEVPDLVYLIAPIGGGSGASGACIAAKGLNPQVKVIGVQAEGAPAQYLSWKQGRLVETETCNTFADGLATRVAFQLPLNILSRHLDDMVLVSDQEIRKAIVLLANTAHQLAEGAGAAATAAAWKMRDRIKGKRVGLMLSGGNIPFDVLQDILTNEDCPA